MNCCLPGCASCSLGLGWTPLPSSPWPGRPPAVRSVCRWSPGEGSGMEMMKPWPIRLEVDFSTPQRGVSIGFFSLLLCPTVQALATSTTARNTQPHLSMPLGTMSGYSRPVVVWHSKYTQTGLSVLALSLLSLLPLHAFSCSQHHITLPAARCIPVSILLPCQGFLPPEPCPLPLG